MGDTVLRCPLCCNETFYCKKSLADHLSSVLLNITCPICADKFPSAESLIEHMNSDNCETSISVHTVEFTDKPGVSDNENEDTSEESLKSSTDSGAQNGDIEGQIQAHAIKMKSESDSDVNKMYVELLSKQLLKPCLQTQELKLVMENGESRYVVLSNDAVQNFTMNNTVVTKQNYDGTISLTTIQEPKEIIQDKTPQEAPNVESDENQMEIYSCNTCGVSFSSVIEHIQNYHNDQDVVVEEPLGSTNNVSMPIEFEPPETIKEAPPIVPNDKVPLRRMITETGDVVEIPVEQEVTRPTPDMSKLMEISPLEINTNKQGHSKRFVQKIPFQAICEKTYTSVVKNTNEDEVAPYHKVVLKELVTTTGGKVKIYNCISCNLYVSTIAEFKSKPCKVFKYPCPHCPVAYENSKSLCAHMKVHKSKTEKASPVTFECAICSTVFSKSKSLKLHKRMHDPIKSRPIDPPVETKLGNPVSEDKYLCVICDKMIPVDYKGVHQNSHKSTSKMNCHICNKKFSSREYLDMHMNVHNLDKIVEGGKQDKSLPYNCVYCNRQFARPHEKVKHERIHTGEKPHSCEICGKSFRVSYCLTLHMRTHTGARPYACPHCGKRFKAHSVYTHHLLTHSDVRAYKCPFCPKAFKTSVQLAGHKNSHTKPFSCQQCNRPFASLYAVRVHMDSHAKQNSLKFTCSMCGASYARAFALKDHLKQVHQADLEANALSGLKEEEWLPEADDEEEIIQPLQRDLSHEINEIEMNADSLGVS